jgi:hypothetical protein
MCNLQIEIELISNNKKIESKRLTFFHNIKKFLKEFFVIDLINLLFYSNFIKVIIEIL